MVGAAEDCGETTWVKGPPPHLAAWKPEPRGYPTFDHGT